MANKVVHVNKMTDFVFGLCSEFISRSVRATLQVCTCSSYHPD